MDGQTSEEICKELNMPASHLWVLLYRARLRLANCMKARWQNEGDTNHDELQRGIPSDFRLDGAKANVLAASQLVVPFRHVQTLLGFLERSPASSRGRPSTRRIDRERHGKLRCRSIAGSRRANEARFKESGFVLPPIC